MKVSLKKAEEVLYVDEIDGDEFPMDRFVRVRESDGAIEPRGVNLPRWLKPLAVSLAIVALVITIVLLFFGVGIHMESSDGQTTVEFDGIPSLIWLISATALVLLVVIIDLISRLRRPILVGHSAEIRGVFFAVRKTATSKKDDLWNMYEDLTDKFNRFSGEVLGPNSRKVAEDHLDDMVDDINRIISSRHGDVVPRDESDDSLEATKIAGELSGTRLQWLNYR